MIIVFAVQNDESSNVLQVIKLILTVGNAVNSGKLGGLDLNISLGNGGGFDSHITPTLPFGVQTYQYFHQNLFAFSYLSIISIMNS